MDELERFKTEINLTEYAASQGYSIDRQKSSRNSVTMQHSSGDKIIIARGLDRHWIFFSVRDDDDNGSIIDFVMKRKGLSLGQVRQELRPWIGEGRGPGRPPVPVDVYAPHIEPSSPDRRAVIGAFARMRPVSRHAWLEEARRIPAAVLESPRFLRRLYTDGRGNAVFPHYDHDGVCGFEIKNRGFTGFAKGGEKGLWISAGGPADAALVIAESAIDALSYAALHPDANARYASTGGSLNPAQPELIAGAIRKLPAGAEVVIATDADQAGRDLARRIEEIEPGGQGGRDHAARRAAGRGRGLEQRPQAPLPGRAAAVS
jgi:hypothetical protein